MELKPCPFCGSEGVMHMAEYPPKNVQYKKEIPKGARLIRFAMYPSGTAFYEFREKAFIPQCSDSKCVGRSTKMFTTEDEAVEAWNRRTDSGNEALRAELERKQKEIELARRHEMRWISVKDKLPADESRCLVCRYDYVKNVRFIDILWYEAGTWWNRLFPGDFAVTHWMLLPEPPKGDNDAESID